MVTVPVYPFDPGDGGVGARHRHRLPAAQAFARLPERWRAVLWHTEVEGLTPAEVAPLLGLTPNGVSSLACRARESLKAAYLQVHVSTSAGQRCGAAADRLGAWTRGALTRRERAHVEAHLDECPGCRDLAAELADLNGTLRAAVAPLVPGSAAPTPSGAARSTARQLIGAAVAALALAAAIAFGLAAGGSYPAPPSGPATSVSPTTPH